MMARPFQRRWLDLAVYTDGFVYTDGNLKCADAICC
jgi:hypothetical protein